MSKIYEYYKNRLIEELAQIATLPDSLITEDTGDEIVLRYRPIVLDRSWMNDREAAANNSQYNKLKSAIGNLNITGIADLDSFVAAMNNFMMQPVDVSDHTVAISRVDVLRTFYHLLTSPNEQSKGYDFEDFIAHVFGGQRLDATEEDGIVDVRFSATNIAAKFIRPTGTIKGSMKDLESTVASDGGINFLVATKGQGSDRGVVHFYSFTVDKGNIALVPTASGGKQMNLNLNKLAQQSDLFSFEELPNSPLDLRGCLELTENIFTALNDKFQNILAELQGLVDQVDDLMYKAKKPKETKKAAKGAKEKAEKVRAKAKDIETSS